MLETGLLLRVSTEVVCLWSGRGVCVASSFALYFFVFPSHDHLLTLQAPGLVAGERSLWMLDSEMACPSPDIHSPESNL